MITVTHTHQGWVVGGGNLPPPACWGIFENESAALAFAHELATDLGLSWRRI